MLTLNRCISALSTIVFNTQGTWQELFSLLMQLAQDSDALKRAMTFNLVGQVTYIVFF